MNLNTLVRQTALTARAEKQQLRSQALLQHFTAFARAQAPSPLFLRRGELYHKIHLFGRARDFAAHTLGAAAAAAAPGRRSTA